MVTKLLWHIDDFILASYTVGFAKMLHLVPNIRHLLLRVDFHLSFEENCGWNAKRVPKSCCKWKKWALPGSRKMLLERWGEVVASDSQYFERSIYNLFFFFFLTVKLHFYKKREKKPFNARLKHKIIICDFVKEMSTEHLPTFLR